MNDLVDWAAAAGGPAGVIVGVVGIKGIDWLSSRKAAKTLKKRAESEAGKIDADAAQVMVQTAITLVAPLKQEISDLVVRVDSLESENALTNSRLALAIDHIRALRAWISTHMPDKTPPQPPIDLGLQ